MWVFSSVFTEAERAYAFTPDGYGIFNVRTSLDACRTQEGQGGEGGEGGG